MKCDVHGGSCLDPMGISEEYATLHASWGCGSAKDFEDHECRICESCYNKIKAFIESLGGSIRVMDAHDALSNCFNKEVVE